MSERPSPLDFIKNANLEQRDRENVVRTEIITRKLVEASGVFGGDIEEERSDQVCQEVLGVFGAGYRSTEQMVNTLKNPSATDTQKSLAKENLAVLGKGVFLAMNKSFSNYSSEATETITSQLTGDQIDNILPEGLKGLGKYVVEVDRRANPEEKRKAKEPLKTTREGRRSGYDENLAATRAFEQAGADNTNNDKEEKGMPLFMMSKEDIVTTEMMQRNKEQFHFSPPYPPWFKELNPDQKRLWMVRIKLVNGAAYKQALRNVDAEKLMFNRALDISRDELKLLIEMPKFQEAMQGMFGDLLEWENEEAEPGFRYLRLKKMTEEERKEKERKENKSFEGFPLNKDVESYLTHFEAYKEQLAFRLDGENDSKKIEAMYNAGKRASLESRSAVGAAWNFLYVGNLIESADVDRQLKPTEIVSDKIRTMIHPLQKALGKWRVYKEGSKDKLMGITGEEEPMGGDIASWVRYHLELGDIRDDHTFRDKLKNGEIKPFPKRTLCSIVELLKVKDKNGETLTMAELIKRGEKIELDEKDSGSDLDIYSEYRDIMDGCKTAYAYLSGNAKYKDGPDWSRKFNADIALIRQYNAGGIDDETKKRIRPSLDFVDDPEFIAWVIAASVGFDYRSNRIVLKFGPIGANYNNYDLAVKRILKLPGLVEPENRDSKILEILSADKGYFRTRSMLFSNTAEIAKNEKDMSKSIGRSGRTGERYGDYKK